MSGTLPSELGNLVELTNFDLRKSGSASECFSCSDMVINATLTCILCYLAGDYKVVINQGNKKTAGTLPTELGNLKKWKHAVFGKLSGCFLAVHPVSTGVNL